MAESFARALLSCLFGAFFAFLFAYVFLRRFTKEPPSQKQMLNAVAYMSDCLVSPENINRVEQFVNKMLNNYYSEAQIATMQILNISSTEQFSGKYLFLNMIIDMNAALNFYVDMTHHTNILKIKSKANAALLLNQVRLQIRFNPMHSYCKITDMKLQYDWDFKSVNQKTNKSFDIQNRQVLMQLIQKIIDKVISVTCCKKINLSIDKLCRQSVKFFADRMGITPAPERTIVELSSESSTISDDEEYEMHQTGKVGGTESAGHTRTTSQVIETDELRNAIIDKINK